MLNQRTVSLLRQELKEVDEEIRQLKNHRKHILALVSSSGRNASLSGPDRPTGESEEAPDGNLSNASIVREILKKNGAPMKLSEISGQMQQEYGITPAKTLYQIIYYKAKSRHTFYKAGQSKFGLLEWRTKQKHEKRAGRE